MSDYEWQVKLAAKGLAERDNHPMPKSATTPAAFYEVMAAAALEAIDLPALLDRLTRAERDLEIMREALMRADAEAKYARHKRMSEGEASEESSIASILRGAGANRGPMRTHNTRPSPLPRDPEHSDAAEERRRSSLVPPPPTVGVRVRAPPPPTAPAAASNKQRSRRTLREPLSFVLVAKIRSRRGVPCATRVPGVPWLDVEGRARAVGRKCEEPTTGAQPRRRHSSARWAFAA